MDDLIRRGALLHEFSYSKSGTRYLERDCDNFLTDIHLIDAKKIIRNAPSVDAVEVVHARWTRKDNSQNCKRIGDFEEWYECSACEGDSEHGSAYCPGCGARMDVEAISKTETTTREREARQDG